MDRLGIDENVMKAGGSGREDEDVANEQFISNHLRGIKDSYLIDKLLLPIVTVRREVIVKVDDVFFWRGAIRIYIYIYGAPHDYSSI